MLYLAQVKRKNSSDEAELQLIARQISEYAWVAVADQDTLPLETNEETPSYFGEKALVLVELSDKRQVLAITDAKNWLLTIVQSFLVNGITPTFLQEEAERAEQWRQLLTLQSQDLDRRALELEARREQIEQLEESLKREKKQMESLALQYKEQTQELDRQSLELETLQQELERRTVELKNCLQEIDRLEATLQRERKQMEDTLA